MTKQCAITEWMLVSITLIARIALNSRAGATNYGIILCVILITRSN